MAKLKCAPQQDGIFYAAPLASFPKQAAVSSKEFVGCLDLIRHAFSSCSSNGVVEEVSEGSANKQEGAAMTESALAREAYYIAYLLWS